MAAIVRAGALQFYLRHSTYMWHVTNERGSEPTNHTIFLKSFSKALTKCSFGAMRIALKPRGSPANRRSSFEQTCIKLLNRQAHS